jgi:hypothetical protein
VVPYDYSTVGGFVEASKAELVLDRIWRFRRAWTPCAATQNSRTRIFNRDADARALLAESARNAAYRRIPLPNGDAGGIERQALITCKSVLFERERRLPGARCHAEGRGFESLQPLPRNPAPERDFVVFVVGQRSAALGSVPPNEASNSPTKSPTMNSAHDGWRPRGALCPRALVGGTNALAAPRRRSRVATSSSSSVSASPCQQRQNVDQPLLGGRSI